MLSMYSKAILAFLAVAFYTAQPTASQNITNVMVENISCDHVIVVATVDPVSSTYTFYWKVSINRGDDIELALVGLDGTGRVSVINKSKDYTYNVKNNPSSLNPNNRPFTSRINFTFTDNAFENLIFKTISTPLDISIPNPVNAMVCQENITCEDNTTSCKLCGSDLPGFLSCSNGRKVRGYCSSEGNTTPVFVPEDCDPVTLCTAQPTAAQNITNVTVEAQLCDQVIVVASVDPVSSTYTFKWVISINGSDDIDLALVGLNGNGDVMVINRSKNYTYNVKNDPEFLPNGNNPFTSRLTFNFTDNAYENLTFRVVSTPLNKPIPYPVGAKMCQEDIACEDNTMSCKRCGSDVRGILRCSNGRAVRGYCRGNETAAFDAEDCGPGSQLIGLVLLVVGGTCALIGLIGFFTRKCDEVIDLCTLLFAVIGGVGLILIGIGLIIWRTAEALYLGLGSASIVLGISFIFYGIYDYKKEKK